MSTLYTENSEKWRALADVDYFTLFVKAWIPFNAWYKNYYPNLGSDREAINVIKSTSNTVRNKLISLLAGSDTDSVAFHSYIAKLHSELDRKYIFNKYNERVCFESIVAEQNPKSIEEFERNKFHYKVERRPGRIELTIISNGVTRFSHIQVNGYSLDEIKTQTLFINLSTAQKANLEACYKEINPRKPTNLLTLDNHNCIKVGSIKFINDNIMLCKGIFEILYELRNSLFHGKIIPDKETSRVYEPAYHILHTLVQTL